MNKKQPVNRRGQLSGNKTPAAAGDRYIYIRSAHKVVDIDSGDIFSIESFNATSGISPYGKRGENSSFAVWKNDLGGRHVDRMTYEPGEGVVFFEGAVSFYNTWRAGIADSETPANVTDDDVAPWLNHVAYIWADAKVRELFLNWAAFLIQKPGKKINWAPLLIGEQGVGKDLSIRPLYKILGKDNCQAIDAEDMKGTYQDWAENQLIIAEELPSFHKRDVYGWLKRYVATGTPHFSVNKKYIAQYKVRNLQNWFISSNNDDALAIPPGDRRYLVYKTPAEKHPDGKAYYTPLSALFEDVTFCAKVKAWLLKRDISEFDPGEAPPWTDAKMAMMKATMGAFPTWLAGLFEETGPFHGRSLITAGEIAEYGRRLLRDRTEPPRLRDKISDPRAIGTALAKGGAGLSASPIKNSYLRYRAGEQQQTLWALCTPERYAQLSQDDLKQEYLKDREKSREHYNSEVCPFPPVEEAKPEEQSDSPF